MKRDHSQAPLLSNNDYRVAKSPIFIVPYYFLKTYLKMLYFIRTNKLVEDAWKMGKAVKIKYYKV